MYLLCCFLYITGSPLMVPNVTIDFTFTLSWGEPFNNLDSIVNYTVVWNSGTLFQNFTTSDNTTRIYTITNLIPLTAYTFSVVATNSIGSGPAGVEMITTPSGGKIRKFYVSLAYACFLKLAFMCISVSLCVSIHKSAHIRTIMKP